MSYGEGSIREKTRPDGKSYNPRRWQICVSYTVEVVQEDGTTTTERKRIQKEYSQESAAETRQKVAAPKTPDEIFLNRALELVIEHLADEEYDREALASDMGASSSTVYNKLRSITGLNVSSFIRDIRLKEARRMAEEDPKLRVSDLAYKVGFRDPRYFSTCFKKQFGVQPKEYMESL